MSKKNKRNKQRHRTKVSAKSITDSLMKSLKEKEAEEIARRAGFLKRKRVLIPIALVLACISALGLGKANWIADIHRAYNALTKSQMRYKPFHNRLKQLAFPEFMRMILESALSQLTFKVIEAIPNDCLATFKDIIIHDGCAFGIKANLKKVFPGRFKKSAPAAIELHVTMSGFENSPSKIALAADKEAEKHFRPEPKDIADSLLLADRAFQDKKYFVDIKLANGSFIIRGTKNIRPIILEAYNANGKRLYNLEGRKLKSSLLPRESVDLMVKWKISTNKYYYGRIVVFYKPVKRNKKMYTYLHTNLNRDKFNMKTVGQLYRFRWQIELLFKEIKSHANLHRFDTGKEAIAEGFAWASILTSVFKRSIVHAAELSSGIELSTQRAASSAIHYLQKIIDALFRSGHRKLLTAVEEAFEYLNINARRAHPKRDRRKGRFQTGLKPIATLE